MNRNTLLKSIITLVLLALLPSMTTAATETITCIHTDHLGSPITGRNAAGETIWEQAYAPWGEKQAVAGVPSAPAGVGYTGHVYDEQAGLIYARARWYDPAMGRFLSPDSIRSHQSHPFDLNRFSYAYNSPYYYTDPTGNAGAAAAAVLGTLVVCSRVSVCVHFLGATLASGAAFMGYNSTPSSDSAAGPDVEKVPTGPTTGNGELDDVLSDAVPTGDGGKGYSLPGTQEELIGRLGAIEGAKQRTRPDGGTSTFLPDGTKVDTYPKRDSTGKPGWSVTKPNASRPKIKGDTDS